MTVPVERQLETRIAILTESLGTRHLVFRAQRCSRRHSAGTCWASRPSGPSLVSTEPTTSHPARPARARVANKFWIPSASRASFLSAARTGGDRPGNGLRCWTELIRRVERSRSSPNFRPYQKTGLRRAKILKCFVATTVAALTLQL